MTTVRTTRRWRGIAAVALTAGAVGVIAKRPDVLLGAVVGVAFVTYPHLGRTPTVSIDLERAASTDAPTHGEAVEITVTVRNTGKRTLPDVRIVDGVAPMLPVIDGTARHSAVLRPGAETTFSYTVRAQHGTHSFTPATVIARDLSGGTEVETTVAAETELDCSSELDDVPFRRRTTHRVGQLVTDDGGGGIEFHRTREYRRGDPMSRIDWKRFARTSELTTVEFREERAATAVLCLDARPAAYCGREDEPHAVSHGIAAAEEIIGAVEATRDHVGVAAFGRELCWVPPGRGSGHSTRLRSALATHPTLSRWPPEEEPDDAPEQVAEFRRRLGTDAQVVLFSPLVDEFVPKVALELEADGHAVTVISPDVTASDTVGGTLARLERTNRIRSLREGNVRVIDWDPETYLATAVAPERREWA